MIKCPICPAQNVPEDAATCPACGADLSPISKVRELATSYYNEALQLEETGATDLAIGRLTTTLTLDGKHLEARKLLGKLLWRKNLRREAIDQWEQASKLAPEDESTVELLAVAKQRIKLGKAKKTAVGLGVLICLIVFVSILALFITNFAAERFALLNDRLSSLGSELDETRIRFEETEQAFSTYMSTHTHSDNEYAKLAELSTSYEQRFDEIRKTLNLEKGYRENASNQLRGLQSEIGQLRSQYSHMTSSLAVLEKEIEVNVRELMTAKKALNNQREYLAKYLPPLLESLRPDGAYELEEKINKVSSQLERLRNLKEQHKARGIILIDSIIVFDIKNKINSTEKQLSSLQEKYNRHVKPWKRAMEIVGELTTDDTPVSKIK